MIDERLSDKKLLAVTKKEYGLVKRVPKVGSAVIDTVNSTHGIQAFDSIVSRFLLSHSFISVFDVTTFKLDNTSLKCWTIPGIRPELRVKAGYSAVHAMCCVSHAGIDMLVLKKSVIIA